MDFRVLLLELKGALAEDMFMARNVVSAEQIQWKCKC
jgi:hypothetical protein